MSPLESAAATEAMQWLVLLLTWLGALVVGGVVINLIRVVALVTVPFVCSCGWRGLEPSMSDASEVRLIGDEWVLCRDHIPLCPLCFQQVRRDQLQPRAAAGAFSRV